MNKALIIIVAVTLSFVNAAFSKVDPPNYNFSLDNLQLFLPGNTLKDIQAKHGQGELVLEDKQAKIYRFYVAQIRYKFPVFVSIYQDKSVDFHARLPTYFLHDLFHQALINRYGKQDEYFKHEASALYIWKNKDGVKHSYSGTCTITCFPMWYSATAIPSPIPGYIPITDSFNLLGAPAQ